MLPMLYVVEVHPEDGVLRFAGDIETVNDRHKIKVRGYLSFLVLWLRKTDAAFDETEPIRWRGEAPPSVVVVRNSPHQVTIALTALMAPSRDSREGPYGFFANVVQDGRRIPGPDPTIINVEPPAVDAD
jgi:hypothetical protein